MSDIVPPTIQFCRFPYRDWRKSLAQKKEQDPSGIPVKIVARVIGPVLIPLPVSYRAEAYAANIVVSGEEPPRFVGFEEQPGRALWQFEPETILVQNFLNRRCRARIEVTIIEGPLRSHLSQLIHASRTEQQAWAVRLQQEGSDPHARS